MVASRASQAPHDVFDHDDRVVDDETDGRGHPPEGHDVEPHAENGEHRDRCGEYRRHDKKRYDCDLAVAQKDKENDRGQDDADENRVAYAFRRLGDENALVVPDGNLDTWWQDRA